MAGNSQQQDGKEQQGKGGQGKGQQAGGQLGAGVPLSADEQQKAQQLEGQIEKFEQQLEGMSNAELKKLSTKLESVERAMMLEKIDNELHTIKEAIVKPGDASSTAAAGSAAAAAVVINE